MATQTDITVVQGETKVFTATWMRNGSPQPLSDYIAHMQVRRRPGRFNVDPILELTSLGDDAPLQLEPGDQVGQVYVRISANASYGITRNCWYDLFLINRTDPTDARRLVYGQVLLAKSATDNRTLNIVVEDPDEPSTGGGTGGGTGTGVSQADFDALAARVEQLANAVPTLPLGQAALDARQDADIDEVRTGVQTDKAAQAATDARQDMSLSEMQATIEALQAQVEQLSTGSGSNPGDGSGGTDGGTDGGTGGGTPAPSMPKPSAVTRMVETTPGVKMIAWDGNDAEGNAIAGVAALDVYKYAPASATYQAFQAVPSVNPNTIPDGPISWGEGGQPIGGATFEVDGLTNDAGQRRPYFACRQPSKLEQVEDATIPDVAGLSPVLSQVGALLGEVPIGEINLNVPRVADTATYLRMLTDADGDETGWTFFGLNLDSPWQAQNGYLLLVNTVAHLFRGVYVVKVLDGAYVPETLMSMLLDTGTPELAVICSADTLLIKPMNGALIQLAVEDTGRYSTLGMTVDAKTFYECDFTGGGTIVPGHATDTRVATLPGPGVALLNSYYIDDVVVRARNSAGVSGPASEPTDVRTPMGEAPYQVVPPTSIAGDDAAYMAYAHHGEWTAQPFQNGAVVVHEGMAYVADSAPSMFDVPGQSPAWKPVVDDTVMRFRGAYVGQALRKGDVVTFDDGLWRAAADAAADATAAQPPAERIA